ncbi:hypothetical protein [Rickettsiales endosymbiont of Peranema trichophorum]|uniref:hypothetical protein n=1 Tax=Rickettsiales endosymbiont of Peranema trichophorum TaxID=2486577 RepID=UPI0013EEC0FB|nr:hypothetical protein [Rickettsiales endosymbiont of Peranema trichophorum]
MQQIPHNVLRLALSSASKRIEDILTAKGETLYASDRNKLGQSGWRISCVASNGPDGSIQVKVETSEN